MKSNKKRITPKTQLKLVKDKTDMFRIIERRYKLHFTWNGQLFTFLVISIAAIAWKLHWKAINKCIIQFYLPKDSIRLGCVKNYLPKHSAWYHFFNKGELTTLSQFICSLSIKKIISQTFFPRKSSTINLGSNNLHLTELYLAYNNIYHTNWIPRTLNLKEGVPKYKVNEEGAYIFWPTNVEGKSNKIRMYHTQKE